jgi:deazaflavin-dependent oxidoreductase (nitroreductase family)
VKTPESPVFWKAFGAMAKANTWIYRRTGGKVGGRMGRAPILLLHHVGAKSGTKRVTPLLHLPDGERVVIVASKGGVQKNPAWFHNLKAHPETEVEIGRERRPVRARVAEGEEREGLWRRLVEIYPNYAEYQRNTDRRIPVVVLEPR